MTWEEEALVGLWSRGAGYYDTFSAEWLIFKPDGTGRLVYLNPSSDSSHYFRWRIASPGVLDLIGQTPRAPELDGQTSRLDNTGFHFPGVRYSVSEAERPPGTGNWILELQLSLEMPWPSSLGFVTKDFQSAEARLQNM